MFSVEFKMYFLVDMCDDLLCAKFGIITRIPRGRFLCAFDLELEIILALFFWSWPTSDNLALSFLVRSQYIVL